ncbi:lipoprotein-releasing ABC transporter permease subunit [Leeia oryzae]|uniref:lipoprotein-releasing ABC transporter permease subunit n=1 Tax=Leeia oryzae TaxID=356662 RepID=UPI00037E6303|nr:lipoprotein-releasing ABC transporter permease subunit [Leeia oryzae]
MHYFEILLGLRYTRAKRRNNFISFISLASMLGIALGVLALITVLSVMNGFQKDIRAKLLGGASHIEVGGNPQLDNWPQVLAAVSRQEHVTGAAPYVFSQGLLTWESNVRGAMIRGIDPAIEGRVVDVGSHMQQGRLDSLTPGKFNIVLGSELARQLGVFVGDKVVLVAPDGQVTPAGVMPRMKQFRVSGIFNMDLFEYDAGMAMIHIKDAQRLYRLGDAVTGIRVKVDDPDRAPAIRQMILRDLPKEAYATDWTLQNATYFRAVQIEKNMMFIILTLIVAVAAFNLVSTLVMSVTDKQSDIAILRTLGASPSSIMGIFMVQGTLTGFIGTLLGVVGGVSLSLNIDVVVPWLERLLGIHFLSKEVYFVSELPSDLHWGDVGVITVIALLLSLLATIYPSWRASRVQPAEALRYE